MEHHAFTRGRLLFSKDEETRIELVDETVRQYADARAVGITKIISCGMPLSILGNVTEGFFGTRACRSFSCFFLEIISSIPL